MANLHAYIDGDINGVEALVGGFSDSLPSYMEKLGELLA